MTDTKSDIDTLNSLLATVVDSVDGLTQAADGVDSPRIKSVFAETVAERRAVIGELEQEIRALGGTPEEEGTILASMHRVLIRSREALSNGDVAVVDEAERGEDYIKNKFRKAADDDSLSSGVRQAVSRIATRVIAGHDRVSALKHELHA